MEEIEPLFKTIVHPNIGMVVLELLTRFRVSVDVSTSALLFIIHYLHYSGSPRPNPADPPKNVSSADWIEARFLFEVSLFQQNECICLSPDWVPVIGQGSACNLGKTYQQVLRQQVAVGQQPVHQQPLAASLRSADLPEASHNKLSDVLPRGWQSSVSGHCQCV